MLDPNCGKVSGLLVVYIPFKYPAKNTQLVITLYNLYNNSMDIYPLIYISLNCTATHRNGLKCMPICYCHF